MEPVKLKGIVKINIKIDLKTSFPILENIMENK